MDYSCATRENLHPYCDAAIKRPLSMCNNAQDLLTWGRIVKRHSIGNITLVLVIFDCVA